MNLKVDVKVDIGDILVSQTCEKSSKAIVGGSRKNILFGKLPNGISLNIPYGSIWLIRDDYQTVVKVVNTAWSF